MIKELFGWFKKTVLPPARKKDLICTAKNTLTAKKDAPVFDYEKILFDLYYIKHGIVHSVRDTYFKRGIPCYKYFQNNGFIPKSYFDIAADLGLNIDKESYIRVTMNWMEENAKSAFYNNIKSIYLPDKTPESWGDLDAEILNRYVASWESSGLHVSNNLSMYADLFDANGKICLITGAGKSDVCRASSMNEIALDSVLIQTLDEVLYASVGLFGGEAGNYTLEYCVHMLSPEETYNNEIVEVDLLKYMRYANGNICIHGNFLRRFYKSFVNQNVKYIIVPYYETFEERVDALRKYLM